MDTYRWDSTKGLINSINEEEYENVGWKLKDILTDILKQIDEQAAQLATLTTSPPAAPTRADIEPILIKGAHALIRKGTVDEEMSMQMLGGALWLWREGESAMEDKKGEKDGRESA